LLKSWEAKLATKYTMAGYGALQPVADQATYGRRW